jgi:hypothetical protein
MLRQKRTWQQRKVVGGWPESTREQSHPASWSHLTIDPSVWNQQPSRDVVTTSSRDASKQSNLLHKARSHTRPAVRSLSVTSPLHAPACCRLCSTYGDPQLLLCRLFVNLAHGSHWTASCIIRASPIDSSKRFYFYAYVDHSSICEWARREIQISKRVSGGCKRERERDGRMRTRIYSPWTSNIPIIPST